MTNNQVIMTLTIIGSCLGSLLPLLWGAGFLSMSSVIFTGIGGLAGIYYGYKLTR